MGLLQTLGLKPRKVPASVGAGAPGAEAGDAGEPAPPGTGKPAPASPAQTQADKLDADLGKLIDAITALLDQVHDDAAATAPRADLQKLVDGRAKAQAEADLKKRSTALTALIAAANKQKATDEKLLKHTQLIERRETARKEIEVTLGQVTALVLGGINDDGLREVVNKELKKQQAAFAKADRIPDPAASEKALLALKPAVSALLDRAEKAKQVTDFVGDTWQPLLAKAKAAVGAVGTASAQKVLQAQLDAVEKEFKTKVAASDLATLKDKLLPTLQRIEKTAGAITTGTTEIDAKLDAAAKLATEMGADATQALIDRLDDLKKQKASTWPAGATLDEIEKSLKDFGDAVTALAAALAARKKIFDDKKAYEKAYAAIKADVDEAQRIYTTTPAVLTYKASIDFLTAKQAVDAAVALPDWPKATAALPELKRAALAVKKAVDDEKAFRAAYNPLLADLQKVRSATWAPGLPPALADAFKAADTAVSTPMGSHEWAQALAKVPDLKKALADAQKAMNDGKKFYAAFAAMQADWTAAVNAWTAGNAHAVGTDNAKLSAARGQLMVFKRQMDAKVAAQAWDDATAIVPDLKAASKTLVAAQTAYDTARVPFDTAKAAVAGSANAAAAKAAVGSVTPTTSKEVNAYKQALIAVDDAEHAGDFAKATAALPAWQKAIDDLATAQAAQDAAKASFEAAYAALTDYAEAKQVAAGPVPALAAAAKDFNAADNTIQNARKVGNWVGANNALPALKDAAAKLVAGKAEFNKGVKPADESAFADKLKALEPRTAKASDAPVPAFVETLQKTVRGRLADIQASVGAKDLAAAEANLVKLEADLTAMEAGKARYAAHLTKFTAAKNGEIAIARALALVPPGLAADRTAGLAATEADIVALADKDQIAQADARVAGWLIEARGWKESQKAYAELHNGKVPDVKTLEDLAKKPGGDKVLDQMILKLPAGTPAKVLNAALKARYGFEVKRFAKMNAEVTDLSGLKGNDPEQPDPELVEVYKLLAKIPNKQVKGKIEELVDFDVNDQGGVYYPNKKIYVHSGRVGDLAAGSRELGKKGEVVPEDEEVDESCQPDNSKPPVPASNYTLLHEAAHAEDAGTSFMKNNKGGADFGRWKDETPATIAPIAAAHLKFDEAYILATLNDKNCKPPAKVPPAPKGVADWEARRQAAVDWCQAIRASSGPWWNAGVCKQVQIGGRVYQESYNDGRWSSYDYAARGRGISGYQFRAAPEWFAELYAAFFSDKLKPSHPAMKWLKNFKPPSP